MSEPLGEFMNRSLLCTRACFSFAWQHFLSNFNSFYLYISSCANVHMTDLSIGKFKRYFHSNAFVFLLQCHHHRDHNEGDVEPSPD